MAFTKGKVLNILSSVLMTGLLTTGIGTGSAFADGGNGQASNSTESVSSSVYGSESTAATVDSPKLLPDSVFYFVKTVYEQIELALTFNQVKKAQLLAEFAQERIAEANALLANGKPDLAKQLLLDAVKNQENVLQQNKTSVPASTNSTNSMNSTNSATATNSTQSTVSGNGVLNPGQLQTTADDEEKDSESAKADAQIQHNILALAMALQHVNNPHAQAALLKNIEKSFGHLEKKLAKESNQDDQEDREDQVDQKDRDSDQKQSQAVSSNSNSTSANQAASRSGTDVSISQSTGAAVPAASTSIEASSADLSNQEHHEVEADNDSQDQQSVHSEHGNKEKKEKHGEGNGNGRGKH